VRECAHDRPPRHRAGKVKPRTSQSWASCTACQVDGGRPEPPRGNSTGKASTPRRVRRARGRTDRRVRGNRSRCAPGSPRRLAVARAVIASGLRPLDIVNHHRKRLSSPRAHPSDQHRLSSGTGETGSRRQMVCSAGGYRAAAGPAFRSDSRGHHGAERGSGRVLGHRRRGAARGVRGRLRSAGTTAVMGTNKATRRRTSGRCSPTCGGPAKATRRCRGRLLPGDTPTAPPAARCPARRGLALAHHSAR